MKHRRKTIALVALALVLAGGALVPVACFNMRGSDGAGNRSYNIPRAIDAGDVALPEGFRIEPVATGLTYPTGVTFDDKGEVYIVEAGYSYGEDWTTPQLVRIGRDGSKTVIAQGEKNGPWTGVFFHEGSFYVAEGGQMAGGRILRISPDGDIRVLVDSLPSQGDHHTNGPIIGTDGWLYFGQGTVTNSAVVGEDNYKFGWLKRYPKYHDIPGEDITLTGENFKSKDVLNPDRGDDVETGAFSPFGTPTENGQLIKGGLPCNGAVMRIRPEGGNLELVAWGFRNPFGLAFSPDNKLYVTDNLYDTRGSRPVHGAGDLLWEVRPGTWYGWPDFHGTKPLDYGDHFKPPGEKKPRMLLAAHPNTPPEPVAKLAVHSSSDGFDFSRSEAFGYPGQAFIAQFGDQAPTVGKVISAVGCKVVRVDVESGIVYDFAVNKGAHNGPASWTGGKGLERPVAARFTPDGATLYVVDFGVMQQDDEGSHPLRETGVLWRIGRATTAGR